MVASQIPCCKLPKSVTVTKGIAAIVALRLSAETLPVEITFFKLVTVVAATKPTEELSKVNVPVIVLNSPMMSQVPPSKNIWLPWGAAFCVNLLIKNPSLIVVVAPAIVRIAPALSIVAPYHVKMPSFFMLPVHGATDRPTILIARPLVTWFP